MRNWGRIPQRRAVACLAVLLLLFQATASLLACRVEARFLSDAKWGAGSSSILSGLERDLASACSRIGAGKIAHQPSMPAGHDERHPQQDHYCPACPSSACHASAIFAAGPGIVPVSGKLIAFRPEQADALPGVELAFNHNRDPPFVP